MRTARPSEGYEALYRMLTPDEAAAWLGVSRRYLDELEARGVTRPVRLGKVVRYPLWGLIAWVCKETGAPEPKCQYVSESE